MTDEKIKRLVEIRPYLRDIPIVANADFGHTSPLITFPIGGEAALSVTKDSVSCRIVKH